MKKFRHIFILLLCYMASMTGLYAQGGSKLVLEQSSFAPVHKDALTGVNIDPIGKDRSNRECARVKIHVTRLSSEDIADISVKTVGGNILVMKRELASGGNGLIVEMTARPGTRFYLHHDIFGESNVVTVDLEGNKEYLIEAWCNLYQPITVACDRVGAEVFLDGGFKGHVGPQGVLVIPDVTTGQHVIKVADASDEASMTIEVTRADVYFSIPLKDSSSLRQFVLFNVEPSNATIELDGSVLPVSDGTASKMMRFGTYSYKVYAPKYHPVQGTVTVNSTEKRSEVKVVLLPAFGSLDIVDNPSLNGADVYIDDEYLGKAPLASIKLSDGSHKIRFVKPMYEPYEQRITIKEGETLSISPKLTADFVKVTLRAVAAGEIWINGSYKESGSWTGELSKGSCFLEVRKDSHRTASITMDIDSSTPSVIDLPSPEPIYGKLAINTTPAMATVHISGLSPQETPVVISNILVGTHDVRISKDGYQDYVKTVTIKEGETVDLDVTLTKGSSSSTTSSTRELSDYIAQARKGDASAQFEVGECYYYGRGTSVNYTEAVKWYRKAAEQGYARGQHNLGICYQYGKGVTKDLSEAFKWYRKSAEQGYAYAQNALGICYEYGDGVDKDVYEAVSWYRKSAEQGYDCAQYNLGKCYDNGVGVSCDVSEAHSWYLKAADQGHAGAMNSVGSDYFYGTAVSEDKEEAFRWFQKSADAGSSAGQYNVGYCYEYGLGVARDEAEAKKWYKKSADQGFEDAKRKLSTL